MTMTRLQFKLFGVLFCICMTSVSIQAQQIKALLSPKTDGYQTIAIPQEFRSMIGHDAGMVRIKNKQGEDVPYIQRPSESYFQNSKDIVFSKSKANDSTDIITIDNKTKNKRNSYIFKIANSSSRKTYAIEGSDDKKNWFNLVNSAELSDIENVNQTYIIKEISFPLTDYRFIRFVFQNNKSASINVLNISQMETLSSLVAFEKLRQISFKKEEDKKNKWTLINISKDVNTPIDGLKFYISAPTHYNREVQIYTTEHYMHKRKDYTQEYVLAHQNLTNDGDNEINLESSNQSTVYIKIFNQDNPPLQIDSITFYQRPIQLISELKSGEQYYLEADTSWKQPSYDLKDSNIPISTALAHQATVNDIQVSAVKKEDTDKNKYGNMILIIGSVIGVLLVFYFGNGLLKDMKKDS